MDPFSLTKLNPLASSNRTNSLNFKIVSYSPHRFGLLLTERRSLPRGFRVG
jgi:hypothetical protein